MNQIILEKNGSIVHKGQAIGQDPLSFLSFQVKLADAYTLRSFFQMFEKYPVLARLNSFSVSFLEQYRKCPEKNCICPGMDCLEIGKTIEMTGFPGEPGMEIYRTFNGVEHGRACDIKSFWLDNLLDMSVHLGKLKHVIFGDQIERFDFHTVYNLFELIDGILWGLSFHNMPAECRITL